MADATLAFGRPCPGVEIQQLCVVAQCLESMGEALGDEEFARLVGAQFDRMPAQEGGRTGTQVDRNIMHATANAADQLGLRGGRALVMHAAHRAPSAGRREVDLDEMQARPQRCPLVFAEQPLEAAACIGGRFRVHHVQAG